ncbi:MAG: hypothetical protein Hyperionvirus3_37 [Hyperionvirus sp.]|uniref:Uncharacterized protein n=1 Tax=Hyperionvirus sp. TaxID=2487770 RepID=A0A3G5A9M7_9VIRU|nr:MAG: hypothetical protein Hyperionvirus3_37 [Hyperionvirus sp.]
MTSHKNIIRSIAMDCKKKLEKYHGPNGIITKAHQTANKNLTPKISGTLFINTAFAIANAPFAIVQNDLDVVIQNTDLTGLPNLGDIPAFMIGGDRVKVRGDFDFYVKGNGNAIFIAGGNGSLDNPNTDWDIVLNGTFDNFLSEPLMLAGINGLVLAGKGSSPELSLKFTNGAADNETRLPGLTSTSGVFLANIQKLDASYLQMNNMTNTSTATSTDSAGSTFGILGVNAQGKIRNGIYDQLSSGAATASGIFSSYFIEPDEPLQLDGHTMTAVKAATLGSAFVLDVPASIIIKNGSATNLSGTNIQSIANTIAFVNTQGDNTYTNAIFMNAIGSIPEPGASKNLVRLFDWTTLNGKLTIEGSVENVML